MDTRFRDYIQKERKAAINEFVKELSHQVCNVKRYYKKPQWTEMMEEIRTDMFNERDMNKEKIEPILGCCIGTNANGKPCSSKPTQGPHCQKHVPKG
jgi:hypothetical protein